MSRCRVTLGAPASMALQIPKRRLKAKPKGGFVTIRYRMFDFAFSSNLAVKALDSAAVASRTQYSIRMRMLPEPRMLPTLVALEDEPRFSKADELYGLGSRTAQPSGLPSAPGNAA